MIRVALLCDQLRLQQDLSALLSREGFVLPGIIDHPSDVLDKVAQWTPDLLLLVEPFGGADTGRVVHQVQSLYPAIPPVVLARGTDPARIRQFFRSGVADVLTLPTDLPALPEALRDAVRVRSGADGAGGKVIGLWAPKGGAGCSLLTANLGVLLQQRHRRRTMLIDLCGPFGGASAMLGITPERSLSDLFRVMAELTETHLSQALTMHESGLSLLAAPRLPEPHGGLLPEHIGGLTRLGRSQFDLILLDIPSGWGASVPAAIGACDRLLLIITPDGPAIQTLQAAIGLLPPELRERLTAGLIINRVSPRLELRPKEIEAMTGLPIVATLPSDFLLLEPLINTGRPIPPRSSGVVGKEPPLTRDLAALAARLA